jgi:hypothetical protein
MFRFIKRSSHELHWLTILFLAWVSRTGENLHLR